MVLEAVLYFALGFLCAGLITLAVSPVIWNRAVTLTQRRFENSVPMTVNEIQAEKDRLRAEFAMELRRTEMELDEERNKTSLSRNDLARTRDKTNALERSASSYKEAIRELENKAHEANLRLEDKERQLSNISDEQDKLSREYSNRLEELSRLRDELSKTDKKLTESQISISERDERIRKLKDRVAALGTSEDDRVEKIETLQQEVRSIKSDLKEEKAKLRKTETEKRKLEKNSERTHKQLNAMEEKPLDPSTGVNPQTLGLQKLEEELKRERTRRIDLEMQLASEVLQAQAHVEHNTSENDGVLKAAKTEVETLKRQIETLKARTQSEIQPDHDLSNLKAQMDTLAAKMVVIAAKTEGDTSKIHTILSNGEEKFTTGHNPAENDLASRIRREMDKEHGATT